VRELMTDVDPELAALVRERLDARVPRLPARFVPPPQRPVRRRRVAAIAVAAFLLGAGVAMLLRPAVSSTVLSGVLGLQPVATPTPAAPGPPRGGPGAGQPARTLPSVSLPAVSPSPPPTPSAAPTAGAGAAAAPPGTAAPAATPAPQQSAPITIQVSLPPLLPTPAPRPSPTPVCLLGLICVKH
jgi:hypothetical protein